MLGMIAALALIWIGFHLNTLISSGEGLVPMLRNLWNFSVQTSSIAGYGDRHGARYRHAPY